MFVSGDPVSVLAGENWTKEEVATFRHELGLDHPWPIVYLHSLGGVIRGNFGTSLAYHQPVSELIVERLPATILLAVSALALSVLVGLPLGVLAATHRNTWFDGLAMISALIGQSVPGFWLGIILILVFGVKLHLLPFTGAESLSHLVLPSVALSAYSVARDARIVRSGVLNVLGEDFVRTARAKGLPERTVLIKHVLRNALLAVVTVVGLDFGFLLGGAVITETVFAWPGLGRMTIQAIYEKDVFLVQGAVFLFSFVTVVVNLFVDISYTLLDPRIQFT
jgi:peptide/nickel transport system permease protein